ncbi:MAG: flagellar hook-associated protein FlgK [Chloroflexi bacterium]|nr:flagellar hook-associated protein FlgK [Chloroflexota bacterium]
MTTIFSGLNLALRAMLAHQQAQLVTDHNISNVNTPGYTRQEAVLATAAPYTRNAFNRPETGLQLGMGAYVSSIRRFTLDFFDRRLREEIASTADWGERSQILQQIESVLHESETSGLGRQLNQFWSAWQNLNNDPASMVARGAVISSAEALTQTIHDRHVALDAMRRDEDALIGSLVGDINTKANAIAGLNIQIINAIGAGDNPNDLLDRRDVLLNELAEVAGTTVHFEPNGDAYVSLGGHILVATGKTQTLSTAPDGANPGMSKVVWADGTDAIIRNGRIAGAVDARDTDIRSRMTALDTLASALITQVNDIHNAAFGLDGSNGRLFFSGSTATDIAVSSALAANPTLIGAAQSAATIPGDGSQALAIAQLGNALVMSDGTRTMNRYWADTIAQLGLDTQRADYESENHKTAREAMERQKQSVTGVSLDEEAARLVQSQRAYEAAARALTAFDQMADTIINRMGIVGR